MLCAQWTYHMTPACLTHTFPFHITCHRLVYLYLPFPVSCVSLCYRFGLTTRLCLLVCLTLTSFGLSTRPLTRYSWTMTYSDSFLTRPSTYGLSLPYEPFVIVSHIHYIYDWDGDLFPIFNLLCNHPKGVTCEIPRTLLVLSSSLAKAICFANLRSSSPLSTHLLVVKSSLRVYFSMLVTGTRGRQIMFTESG